ncbi:hypothetical protein [Streptomyces rhizosphaericus]|uniref:hypothetical protein n=1 Tax=Streptomyces rhizosphaericus TaxID=114699 RepID=UPI000A3B8177|nr:hypothetical protein [Streptomyces rhizosphaericus]
MHYRLKFGTGIAAAGAVLTLVTAPAAHAGTEGCDRSGYCHFDRASGRAHFWRDGDIFRVDDDAADGKSVGIRWKYKTAGATIHTLRNHRGGAGHYRIWNLNLREGKMIAFQYCTWKGSHRSCTSPLYPYA